MRAFPAVLAVALVSACQGEPVCGLTGAITLKTDGATTPGVVLSSRKLVPSTEPADLRIWRRLLMGLSTDRPDGICPRDTPPGGFTSIDGISADQSTCAWGLSIEVESAAPGVTPRPPRQGLLVRDAMDQVWRVLVTDACPGTDYSVKNAEIALEVAPVP